MTTVESRQFAKARAPRVWWSFAIIVLGFVLVNAVSIYEMRNSQVRVRDITKHSVVDIELATRLSRDLDRKRFLINQHILERDTRDMARIEAELARIDAEITAASQSYEPFGDEPDERAAWQQLQDRIAAMEPELRKLILFSRRNMDGPALAVARHIETLFDETDQSVNTLLSINHNRAYQEAAEVLSVQRRAVAVLAALTVIWTVFALLTAKWVIGLIAEREGRMRHALEQLEERNRELDAFAARVAHDLRGPLTAINLSASRFKQRAAYEEAAGNILQRAVTRMETMIQDLLTLSRVGVQTAGATCEMTEVVAGVEEDLLPKVEAVGGILKIDVPSATVPGNKGLLRQVLWNLGENAVKYRRPEVQVKIEIRGRIIPNAYELTVSDNGAGMSPWVARQAFEPFFRGKDAESTPGTGLGLSLVKRVIEASHGTVSLDSEQGQGSIFTICLPLAASKAA
jgi:signal transduction histidine kinase